LSLYPWSWVVCTDFQCGHSRAIPFAPWAIRWGVDDVIAEIRRNFRCSMCGKRGVIFSTPSNASPPVYGPTGGHRDRTCEAFPAIPIRIGGRRQDGEGSLGADERNRAEYLARYPTGDALGEFRGGPPGPAQMCGKFTAMASWSEVVDFSQPLSGNRREGANDEPVTLKVMGQVNVIVWDAQERRRKVVKMRWGFPHPKNWKVPQPIHARSETMDELKTFKRPFLTGQRGIVLMRTFNEGKQVAPSKTEQWTIDPIPEYMMGSAWIFDTVTPPDLSASPFLACVLVTVPANKLIETLTTEHAVSDRMPAFLAPEDWATWLGENGNDPAAAKAACKTREGVRWTMTKEERAATGKRRRPTVSDPGGLL
jgi:putative SOS response-associated peptidase YedK